MMEEYIWVKNVFTGNESIEQMDRRFLSFQIPIKYDKFVLAKCMDIQKPEYEIVKAKEDWWYRQDGTKCNRPFIWKIIE